MRHYLITLTSAHSLIEHEEISSSSFGAICKMLRAMPSLPGEMFRLSCKVIA
ncbi:hypothetical protein GALL_71680 [mine drainage metagenome]|uniref:Uncharacterized protein n=1 Tax=mine drainage metagenome TaxID=410659 RepID=A0A1J5T412_9ZZZZ